MLQKTKTVLWPLTGGEEPCIDSVGVLPVFSVDVNGDDDFISSKKGITVERGFVHTALYTGSSFEEKLVIIGGGPNPILHAQCEYQNNADEDWWTQSPLLRAPVRTLYLASAHDRTVCEEYALFLTYHKGIVRQVVFVSP